MQDIKEVTRVESTYSEIFEELKENFYRNGKNYSIPDRIKKLKRLKKWIIDHQDKIVQAIQNDLSKPEIEAKLMDIKTVLWEIDFACKKLNQWARPKKGTFSFVYFGSSSKTLYEPLGIVLILAPWNFPFNLCIAPLVSAIAAGNNVIIKPSELAAATSTLIERMINELFSPNEIKVITGEADVAEELLKLPFNHIFFTGSPAIGKKVMQAASNNLTSVTLELGGCNPVIIDNTANLQDAAQKIIYGKLINAGQSCLAVNTVYIEKSREQEFIKLLLSDLDFRYNNDSEETLSKIINKKQYNRILESVYRSKESGAVELTDAKTNKEKNYISPIILTNVPENSPLVEEEIFGPVLPIVTYNSLDELIRKLQKKASPLALYIFSNSNENIQKIIKSTSSGTIAINETSIQFGKIDLPFGGINNSGIGKSHGYHGFLSFSNQRAVLKQRVGLTSARLIYPPYTKTVKKIADFIFKFL